MFNPARDFQAGSGRPLLRAHVAGDARRHEQADRVSLRISHGRKPHVHFAFRASDQLPKTPIFTPRLEAVRCALR